jgi:cell division protease FtsH
MVEKIKKLIFLFKKFIKGLPLSAKILLGFLTIILFEVVYSFILNFNVLLDNTIISLNPNENSTIRNIDNLEKTSSLEDSIDFFIENNNSEVEKIVLYSGYNHYYIPEIFFEADKSKLFNQVSRYHFNNKIYPYINKNNIYIEWKLYRDKTLNNGQKSFYKEFQNDLYLIPSLERSLIFIFFGIFLLFMMEKQNLIGGSKFDVLHPNEIKGSIDSLKGMSEIKEEIIQLADILKNRHKYAEYNLEKTFNIMFSGPAGTGKTKIAGYLAKYLDLPIILSTGNVETGFIGGGANTLKSLWKKANQIAMNDKNLGCIIFIDEAQILLKKRGGGHASESKFADDASNELLSLLDGVNTKYNTDIIVILASNFDDSNFSVDEAMERRFKKKLYFSLPNKKERTELFEFFLTKIDKSKIVEDIDYDYFGKVSSGLSPAKIETVIEEASLIAIRKEEKIDKKILFKAFEQITVGHTDRKKSEDKEDMRERIIYHELGHFINSYVFYMEKYNNDIKLVEEKIPFLKISSEAISKHNALGYVLSDNESDDLETKSSLEQDVIALYGGLASESFFYGKENVSTGSYNDLEKASKILNNMVNNLGMYSKFKLNLNFIDGSELKEENLKELKKISDDLYNKSIYNVEINKELIEELKNILTEKWVLDKHEIFTYIKEYLDRI